MFSGKVVVHQCPEKVVAQMSTSFLHPLASHLSLNAAKLKIFWCYRFVFYVGAINELKVSFVSLSSHFTVISTAPCCEVEDEWSISIVEQH